MVSLAEVLQQIDQAFPIFSHGERYIEEFLDGYSFDEEGIQQQREMCEQLSNSVMTFIGKEYPQLGARARSACCDLQMALLRERIRSIASMYDCYCSIVKSHKGIQTSSTGPGFGPAF